MARTISLDQIHIASPCSASWDEMAGDHQSRHCSHCDKRVYNITAMTSQQAVDLIERHEGSPCIRLFRRPDGTVLTNDCPRGLRRKMRWAWARVAAMLALIGLPNVGCWGGGNMSQGELLPPPHHIEPVPPINNQASPDQAS